MKKSLPEVDAVVIAYSEHFERIAAALDRIAVALEKASPPPEPEPEEESEIPHTPRYLGDD